VFKAHDTTLLAACIALAAAWPALAMADRPAPTGLDSHGHLARTVAPGEGFAYTRLEHGVQLRIGAVTKNVIFYAPDTVRVSANLGTSYWTSPSLVVVDRPGPVDFTLEERPDTLTIASERLRIVIDRASGALAFMDGTGRLYTRESAQPQSIRRVDVAGGPTYEVENRLALQADEAIFGFGYTDSEKVNRRNQELQLVQTNLGIIIPVMVSSRRYGILWDTYSKMRFRDGPQGASLWAESAPGGVDYYFMGGASMDGVIGAYRHLTGAAPMYPKGAFGLFMSKERYPTQQRIVEVARTFRKERFPLDYIVQDWQYWGGDKDGTWSGMT
jgi:alpha-D-xyloside xylohydrolase